MNDKKVIEKHYERRWFDAKSEMIKDAGPVIDFFVNMHHQCTNVAAKHGVNAVRLRTWLLEQLPIQDLDDGVLEEEDEEYEEGDE
jgi:hypothetical protein